MGARSRTRDRAPAVTKLRVFILERGGLLALVVLALYAWIAPATIIDGDNAEFSTLAVDGGAAHPSGYPLYVMYLRAMSWLPGSPAHAAALATAILGAAAILVLHAACRAWGARPLGATVACAIFATGPVVLRLHSEAEVFALNNLVVAAVLWLSATDGPLRGIKRAAVLGLVAGLGLSNHLTCVLVAPVGILGVVRAAREAKLAPLAALAGLVVGLLPYAYLLAAPDTPMSWGKVDSLGGVVHMATRGDYGGMTTFRSAAQDVSAWDSLLALVRTVGRAWLYAPALVGVAMLARKCRDWGWAMLALSFAIASALVLRFNVAPHHLGLYVCQRFHVLPALLLAIPIAVVFGELAHRLAVPLVSTVGAIALAALSLPYVGRIHSPAVEKSAKNILASLPQNAVVIHGQDEFHGALGYTQWALGVRQDVVVITWAMTKLAWYRERHAKRGVAPNHILPLVQTVLASGRPVFVDRLQREVIETFPSHPYGVLIRVYPRGTPIPSVDQVAALNATLFERFELGYARPGPDDEYATEVHERYRATWNMIGKMLEATGNRDAAAQAFATAQQLGPHP